MAIVPDPTNANVLYVAMSGWWRLEDDECDQRRAANLDADDGISRQPFLAARSRSIPQTPPRSISASAIPLTALASASRNRPMSARPGHRFIYLGDSTRTTDIHVAQAPKNNIVLVTTDKGLFRSIDGGATFAFMPIATSVTTPAYGGASPGAAG